MKWLLNLILCYLVFIYFIKPFFRGFLGLDNQDNFQDNPRKKDKDGYTDYEEVK